MGKVIKRGEEARQKVIEIVKNGGTWEEAAKETGFRRDYVRQLCAKAGLYIPRKITKNNDELLRKMVEDEATVEAIQDAIGYSSHMSVIAACRRLGLKYPKSEQWYKRQKDIIVYKEQPLFHICPTCNNVFYATKHNIKFCSKACEKRNNHQVNDIKRKRLEQERKVDDIALDDVYKKYNGICYLCGGKCDYNAVRIVHGVPHTLRDYPSREHIIPLSKGGLHTWDNVRLAHVGCNSKKGVRYG